MKTSKQFAEDVLTVYEKMHSHKFKFILERIEDLEQRHLGDNETFYEKVRDLTDFISEMRDFQNGLYYRMFPEKPTQRMEDYTPAIERVRNEDVYYPIKRVHNEDLNYKHLVGNVAYCIYLHRIKCERDKVLLKPNLSPSTASDTKTDTNTPNDGESAPEAITESEKQKLAKLRNPQLALYCVLIGINPSRPMKAKGYFDLTGRSAFSKLVTEMHKVATPELRTSPGDKTLTKLINHRKRFEEILPLLPPDFQKEAKIEYKELKKFIDNLKKEAGN